VDQPFPSYQGDAPYIFVSYSHDDAELVYPEMRRLREQGFNIWYDEGIQPGSTWREEVALALTESKLFLYFVTPSSVVSENCQQELNFALSRERKILAVHLAKTELSMGIELSLSNKQAIIKEDHAEEDYERKLTDSLHALLPQIRPVALPGVAEEKPVDRNSIAILPFVNRSSDPENEYLCDGIAEELISGLSKLKELAVASQLSSFGLKHQNLDTAAIGAKLNVAHVLTGGIQKAGERVRINVTLSEVASGNAIWSEHYDGTLADVFELQEDVARKVVAALKVELGAEEHGNLVDSGTKDAQAYNLFLLGWHEFLKHTRRSYLKAVDYFREAGEREPGFGRAHYFHFIAEMNRRNRGFSPQEEFQRTADLILAKIKASEFVSPAPDVAWQRSIDPTSIPDKRILVEEAIEEISNPQSSWKGYQYWLMGANLVDAGLLNGGSEFYRWYMGNAAEYVNDTPVVGLYLDVLFALGRFEKAIDHSSNILVQQPEAVLVLGVRAMLYSRTGQYAKAEEDLRELAKVFPRNFAQFYHLYWRRELDAAKAYFEWMDSQKNLALIFKIWGCFLLGYIDKGMDYLEQARMAPQGLRVGLLYALTPSIIREVVNHPRYQAELARHGLDDAWRDELMHKVNELEPITGIHVSLDTDY
jgi:TolB-like protein|tara:strand:+ start:1643 stop:3586 length:1944 start_codon:yes stop_codon:yes gene_type:complete